MKILLGFCVFLLHQSLISSRHVPRDEVDSVEENSSTTEELADRLIPLIEKTLQENNKQLIRVVQVDSAETPSSSKGVLQIVPLARKEGDKRQLAYFIGAPYRAERERKRNRKHKKQDKNDGKDSIEIVQISEPNGFIEVHSRDIKKSAKKLKNDKTKGINSEETERDISSHLGRRKWRLRVNDSDDNKGSNDDKTEDKTRNEIDQAIVNNFGQKNEIVARERDGNSDNNKARERDDTDSRERGEIDARERDDDSDSNNKGGNDDKTEDKTRNEVDQAIVINFGQRDEIDARERDGNSDNNKARARDDIDVRERDGYSDSNKKNDDKTEDKTRNEIDQAIVINFGQRDEIEAREMDDHSDNNKARERDEIDARERDDDSDSNNNDDKTEDKTRNEVDQAIVINFGQKDEIDARERDDHSDNNKARERDDIDARERDEIDARERDEGGERDNCDDENEGSTRKDKSVHDDRVLKHLRVSSNEREDKVGGGDCGCGTGSRSGHDSSEETRDRSQHKAYYLTFLFQR